VGPTEEEKLSPKGVMFVSTMYLLPHLRSARSLLHDSIVHQHEHLFDVSRETNHAFEIINTLIGRLEHAAIPPRQTYWLAAPPQTGLGEDLY